MAEQIEGLNEVLAKMKSLQNDAKYKGGRFALRKAANLVANNIRLNAAKIDDPKSAADISANVAVRFGSRFYRRTGDLMFRVGIRGGAGGDDPSEKFDGLPGKDTRHWRQVEFGHRDRKSGKEVAPQPFFIRSLADHTSQTINEFAVQYGKAINRALKRAGR